MAAREELIQNGTSFLNTSPTASPLAATVRSLLELNASSNAAAQTSYSPADPAQWAGSPPATIAEALDRIAPALAGLLGNPIP